MKIAFWDRTPNLGLQEKLKEEGNQVDVFFKGRKHHVEEEKGLYTFRSVKDVAAKYLDGDYDLTFATDHIPGLSAIAYNAIGVSKSRIELNRLGGISFISSLSKDIRIPKSVATLTEAMALKSEHIVVKMENNHFHRTFGDFKTFILSKRDLVHMKPLLDRSKAIYQEFIKGNEVAFGGYFGGAGKFVRPFTWIQEYKRLYPASIRNMVISGESGSCGEFTPNLPPTLEKILLAHEPLLGDYCGFIDINTMMTPQGDTYFLEYTSRMGFPTEYELVSLLNQSYTSFLSGLRSGKDFKVKSRHFASLKVVDEFWGQVPYTISIPNTPRGVYVAGMNAIPQEEKFANGVSKLWRAGYSEDQLLVTATGKSVEESATKLYDYVKKIEGMAIYYIERDVGSNWIW